MTKTPALPAYLALRDEAAPIKLLGIDVVAAPTEDVVVPARSAVDGVGANVAVVFCAETVEVTDATT